MNSFDSAIVTKAIHELLERADKETGEVSFESVLAFFPSIGLSLNATGRQTLHAIFGRMKRGNLLDGAVVETDLEGNSDLNVYGLRVPIPRAFVNVESLSIILLAAIPLKSGEKIYRDYLPQITQLPVVGELAKELIGQVANMLTTHQDGDVSFTGNLPGAVVDGLDLIFNMVATSLDSLVSPDW